MWKILFQILCALITYDCNNGKIVLKIGQQKPDIAKIKVPVAEYFGSRGSYHNSRKTEIILRICQF